MLTRMIVLALTGWLVGMSLGCAAGAGGTGVAALREAWATDTVRGIWVTRWDYTSAEDVRRIMRDAGELGMSDVFWQVRGQADAYYRSSLEPWGEDLFRGSDPGRTDPGFDPLALAVQEAHARGMRIHAWINVMPLWRGTTPPKSGAHAWRARADWRLVDISGELQPLNEHYVIVNPVREDVRDHLVAVAREIVTGYEVDGLHLDYIRFVTDAMEAGRVYPADEGTRAKLEARTGSGDLSSASQQRQLRMLIRESITTVVERLRREVVDRRAGVVLTAAVWRRPEIAREQYEQDAASWLARGVLHAAIPMIYTASDGQFASDVAAWRAEVPGGRIIPGIGVYKHESGEQTLRQVGVGGGEFVLFAYSSLFESASEELDPDDVRRRRLEPLRDALGTRPRADAGIDR